jgi:signal peptidase II
MAMLFIVIFAFLDQLSKWWILEEVMNPPVRLEVTSFFDLVLAWNKGVSFSLLSQTDTFSLLVITGGITLAMLVWLWRAETLGVQFALMLVVGGAVGNLIDRIQYGAVVDFLSFHYGQFYWPAFNLADTFITLGVVVLLLENLIFNKGD